MKCEYHPDADAIEGCIRCQRLICAQCRVIIDGNIYCRQCLNELNKQTERAGCARVHLVDTLANTAELSGHQKCRYHEHENAVAVCVQCGSAICGQCCHERGGKILCGHCLKLSTPSKSHSGLGNTILILVLIVLVSSGIMAYRIVQQHHDKPQTPDYGAFAQSTFVDVQPPVLKVTGEQVKLTNNSRAVDPSFAQLEEFLEQDLTDNLRYIIGERMCASFAETLHNNAELAGIRAAFVGVDIVDRPVGHAFNAFQTTDKGLVYIDCVGPEPDREDEPQPSDYDKIAYVVPGEAYGTISIDKADSLDYSFYRSYSRKWDACEQSIADYNDNVDKFNSEVEGKVYDENSQETDDIREWKEELDRQKVEIEDMLTELGNYRFVSPGIVEDIKFYW